MRPVYRCERTYSNTWPQECGCRTAALAYFLKYCDPRTVFVSLGFCSPCPPPSSFLGHKKIQYSFFLVLFLSSASSFLKFCVSDRILHITLLGHCSCILHAMACMRVHGRFHDSGTAVDPFLNKQADYCEQSILSRCTDTNAQCQEEEKRDGD